MSHLNISRLLDGDSDTCLDLAGETKILTLRQNLQLRYGFEIKVVIPESLEHHRHQVIRVLTSDVEHGSCGKAKELKRCEFLGSHTYGCGCSDWCNLVVKFIFLSERVDTYWPQQVCEIQIQI